MALPLNEKERKTEMQMTMSRPYQLIMPISGFPINVTISAKPLSR